MGYFPWLNWAESQTVKWLCGQLFYSLSTAVFLWLNYRPCKSVYSWMHSSNPMASSWLNDRTDACYNHVTTWIENMLHTACTEALKVNELSHCLVEIGWCCGHFVLEGWSFMGWNCINSKLCYFIWIHFIKTKNFTSLFTSIKIPCDFFSSKWSNTQYS